GSSPDSPPFDDVRDEEALGPAAAHVASTGAGLRMGWGDAAPSRDGPGSLAPFPGMSSAPELGPFGGDPVPDSGLRAPAGFERGPGVPPGGWDAAPVEDAVPVFTEHPANRVPSAYAAGTSAEQIAHEASFREFFGEASQGPPDIGTIRVGDVEVGKGSRVRINPKRRADAHDIFLAGLAGTVAGIFQDVDGGVHVAVTVEDDPSGELDDWYGRYYYFDATEIEPLGDAPAGGRPDRG
ncbi:MAG: hypothetical protein ACRDKW_02340, partial [Actinomycetota bacterium]